MGLTILPRWVQIDKIPATVALNFLRCFCSVLLASSLRESESVVTTRTDATGGPLPAPAPPPRVASAVHGLVMHAQHPSACQTRVFLIVKLRHATPPHPPRSHIVLPGVQTQSRLNHGVTRFPLCADHMSTRFSSLTLSYINNSQAHLSRMLYVGMILSTMPSLLTRPLRTLSH